MLELEIASRGATTEMVRVSGEKLLWLVLDPQAQTIHYARNATRQVLLPFLSRRLDYHHHAKIDMAAHTVRLSRLFNPEYVKRINAQIVHPAPSVVVKPNELESTLGRPLHLSFYEPDKPAPYLAATLSYGIIKGHPFMDGNKRTDDSECLHYIIRS